MARRFCKRENRHLIELRMTVIFLYCTLIFKRTKTISWDRSVWGCFLHQQHFNHHGTFGFDIWRQFFWKSHISWEWHLCQHYITMSSTFVRIACKWNIFWNCDLVVATGAPSIEPASRQDFKIKRTAKKIKRPAKPCVGILFVKTSKWKMVEQK